MPTVFFDLSRLRIWPLKRSNILFKAIIGKPLIKYIIDWIENEFGNIIGIYAFGDYDEIQEIKFRERIYTVKHIKIDSSRLESMPEFIASRGTNENLFLSPLDFFVEVYGLKSIPKPVAGQSPMIVHGDSEELKSKIREESLKPRIIYPWQILTLALELAQKLLRGEDISDNAELGENVVVRPPCRIEHGVKIFENAVLKPPCFIGRGSIVGNNAIVRGSIVEKSSIIGANMEVARSWLGIQTETHSGYIGDSLFAERVHTGAGFITANLRIDQGTIRVYYEGRKIDTGLKKLGAIVGSRVEFGIHSGTMPGILVGNNVIVGPGTLLFENIPDNTKVYVRYVSIKKPL